MSDHSTEDAAASNSETIENALNSLSLEDVRLEGGLSAKRMRMEVLKGSFASTTSFLAMNGRHLTSSFMFLFPPHLQIHK